MATRRWGWLVAVAVAACAPAADPSLVTTSPPPPPSKPSVKGLVLREAVIAEPWAPPTPDTTGWDAAALPDGTRLRLGRPLLMLGEGDVTQVVAGVDRLTGQGQVEITLALSAGMALEAVTRARVGQVVAIMIDDRVLTAPTVASPIPTGQLVISGTFRLDESGALATAIRKATGGASPRSPDP